MMNVGVFLACIAVTLSELIHRFDFVLTKRNSAL